MWTMINTFISATILMIGVFIFGKIVLKTSIEKFTLKKLLFLILICIIQTISFLVFNGTIKTLVMLVNNAILYKCLFKAQTSKAIFAAFVCIFLFAIPDVLAMLVITNIFKMKKGYYYNNFAGGIIANLMTSIIFIIIVLILKKYLRKIINTEINNNIKITILSLITIIPISLFFYSFVKKFEFSNDIIQYLIAICVLATMLFSLIRQTIEHNKLTKEYDKLLEFMTTYENEIEKQRILRHETKNEFLTIRAKIYDKQENKEIINYIDEILKDKIKVNQEKYAKFGYLPPNGIKGLCYFKVQEAENKGINVSLNISKKVKESTIYNLNTKEQREFGRILGVLLDNAIESSEKSTKKQLGIETYVTNNKEYKMIISNTYDDKIDRNKIGKEKFSTKGKNRGHGLLLVKHIINENKIFELKTKVQNNIYSQIIIIKKV